VKRFLIFLLTTFFLLAFCSSSNIKAVGSLTNDKVDSQNLNSETNNNDLTEKVSGHQETSNADMPQTFIKDIDGIVLTVTTNKKAYKVGEPINVTATLENNSGKTIELFYTASTTGGSVELMLNFEHLIEYPIHGDICREHAFTVIPFMQGEKCVQDFIFQTYTDYFRGTSENGYITIPTATLPDYNKIADPGVHYGKLCVQTCSDETYPYGIITDYSLDFSVMLI